jgi:nucleotide-binding universal stress UspA family protein
MFRTTVLAVDGSKYSEKAVELAKRLAMSTNDEVVVTHMTQLLPAHFQTYPGLDYEADREVIELAKGYVAELEEAGVKAPHRASKRAVRRHRPAPHRPGRGPRRRPDRDGLPRPCDLTALLLGSVAHKALHLSQRPVLIAR